MSHPNVEADMMEFMVGARQYVQRTPGYLPTHVLDLRERLIAEEYRELMRAMQGSSLTLVADGIVDLVYVAVGTAVAYGIPFNECWAEVQRSNMTKLKDPVFDSGGKLLKGPSFERPRLEPILQRAYSRG